jgi:ribosomal-protein-alanine N-acetyltransferase
MKQVQLLPCNAPLVGRRLRLHRLHSDHVDLLLDSFSNNNFWHSYRIGQNRELSRELLIKQLQFEYERLPSQVGKIEWLIYRHGSMIKESLIGMVSLSAFDVKASTAEFMISFFEKSEIKTGLGLEASLLVFDYAFNQERLGKLSSYVYVGNESAQRSTLALGFVSKGLLESRLRVENSQVALEIYHNEMHVAHFRDNIRLARLSQKLLNKDVTLNNRLAENEPEGSATNLSASFTIE